MEDISGTRVNLDSYDIDDDNSPAAREFLKRVGNCLDSKSIMIAYRPQKIIDTLCFSRKNSVDRAMMPTVQQRAFDFKPWVEQTLKDFKIPIIDWKYYSERTWKSELQCKASRHKTVVRRMYSSGGSGVFLLNTPDDIGNIPISNEPQVVSASEFLNPSYSLSINAVVFRNGNVTLHSPSVQILGKEDCTDYPFGFCGNDFGAMQDVSKEVIDNVQKIAIDIGKWLYSNGYLGAFGIDILVYKGMCYLAEINPRFLGSSQIGAQLDREINRSDIYLNHLAAFLDIEVQDNIDLFSLVKSQNNFRHVVYHKKHNSKEKKFKKDLSVKLIPHEKIIKDLGCIIGQKLEYKSYNLNEYIKSN